RPSAPMLMSHSSLSSLSALLRHSFVFSTLPRPPRPTLFPYTTLFRSHRAPSPSPASSAPRAAWPPAPRPGRRPRPASSTPAPPRSEEHTSELQSRENLVCRLLLEKKKKLIAPTQCARQHHTHRHDDGP